MGAILAYIPMHADRKQTGLDYSDQRLVWYIEPVRSKDNSWESK